MSFHQITVIVFMANSTSISHAPSSFKTHRFIIFCLEDESSDLSCYFINNLEPLFIVFFSFETYISKEAALLSLIQADNCMLSIENLIHNIKN